MNRHSSGARNAAYALIAGACAWLVGPSSGALAQDSPPEATATSAAPAEAATQSRRDRRRAETAAAHATVAPAPAASAVPAAADATAAAAAPSAAPTASAANTASDGPTRICKNIKPLGTRMAQRVCGTPEQWAALTKKTTEAGAEDMRQVRGTGGVIATTPGPTSTP